MRHFHRTSVAPADVLADGRRLLPALGMRAATARARAHFRAARRRCARRAQEGGHYTFIEVHTDQIGESRLDKNVKKFFVQVHRRVDRRHAMEAGVLMAARASSIERRASGADGPVRCVRASERRTDARAEARAVLLDAPHAHARGAARRAVSADEGRGGLFRSLGQEADAVGSCYALERRDVMSPLIRNLGAMLVKGATPVEVLKQYMAKGDSPDARPRAEHPLRRRRRPGDDARLPRPDLAARRHGAGDGRRDALVQAARRGPGGARVRGRRRDEHRRLPRGDQLRRRAALPAGRVVENNGYAYSTPTHRQTAARQFVDKAIGYGVPGVQATATTSSPSTTRPGRPSTMPRQGGA
jgi:hypothetical protein